MSFINAGTSLFILLLLNCFISHDVMCSPLFISDDEISKILDWSTLIPAVETAMGDLSKKEVIQPARLVMQLPSKDGVLLAMPAFSKNQEALGCKLVTSFKNNQKKGLPSVLATILFMDSNTGKVKVIMEGSEITTWRTAAASVVATKHLHKGEKKILAILGAGTQGRIHAIAMKHYFNFQEVRIWNRTPERAKKLCDELGSWAKHYTNNEDCVRGADVIVTATYATSPIVLLDWVKNGSHINAIGAGITHHSELEEKLYTEKGTILFVDHREAAVKELKGLALIGVGIEGEVGEVINNNIQIPKNSQITVFHSLGMAVEDVVAAKLVYESYVKLHNTTVQ